MIPAAGRAPSVWLPLRYLSAAALNFVLAALAVPWLAAALAGHYYQPRVLALTHTVTLAWITLTIMGASYQLLPIVLERPVWSERLAGWQFILLVVGSAGMIAHFFIGHWSGLVWSAGLLAAGVAAHLLNTVMTVRGLARWTFTARLVALALVGLALTTLAGVALGLDKISRFLPGELFANLHAHVHLALLGWVLPMIVGVAARVYPMFLLAREPDGPLARVQLWGLALGVPAVVAGILASRALVLAGALAVLSAVACHLLWVLAAVRTRKRPRLDWALRFVLAGAAFLVPAAGLGLALALDVVAGSRVALAYAALALGGWASLTIVGMMLKIVPFLVWYGVYSRRAGREAVPTLAQLGSPAAERLAFILLVPGMAALAGALAAGEPEWIRASGSLVAAGALAFAVTLVRVLHHAIPGRAASAGPASAVRPNTA